MELQDLEALRPQIEEREKAQDAPYRARVQKYDLLYRACRLGLIQRPRRGTPWFSGRWFSPRWFSEHWPTDHVCPACGSKLVGHFEWVGAVRMLVFTCAGVRCDYEWASE